jgi:3-hydroxymyristoyl/3-hydroxydecanoyl-(acyl carrier protein) dehydratase
MQKRQDVNPEPPATQSTPASARADLVSLQHGRTSSAHSEFLRMQEQMHREFLSHRQRLLEWLRQARPSPQAAQHVLEPQALPPARPPASAPEEHRFTLTTDVTWEDAFLDSHVLPLGALLAPLGRAAPDSHGDRAAFGEIECELHCFGALPGPGDTVVTDLTIAQVPAAGGQPGVQFQMDCRIRSDGRPLASVRGGHVRRQTSLPPPADRPPSAAAGPALPGWTLKRQFAERDLAGIFSGDPFACFGKGFERAASHTRTPPLPGGQLIRLTRVGLLEPTGGVFSLGLLRAQVAPEIASDVPPCEDAGLRLGRLYQGAQQMLAFFAMAAGCTVSRDGWRFEALEGHSSRLRFIGAPGPESPLEYELVVERFEATPFATVVGDVRAWSAGTLVFHGERLTLGLVPDWPLSSDRRLVGDGLADDASGRPAADIDGFRIGYSSLLAGALGRPTQAFNRAGEFFEKGDRQMPRLPGPPYHFITRVTAIEGEPMTMRPGAAAKMDYDVPPDAWYFDENGNRTMPWCVLLEAALQPCGWLSVYVGCPLATSEDVFFRNLDGAGSVRGEVFPGCTLQTRAKVVSVTRVSGITLISYKIECFVGERLVCDLTAGFGYFPNEALAAQVGLPTSDTQRAQLAEECPFRVDLTERPERYCGGSLRLPGPMLLMIDRVTGFWPTEGAAGKGRLRAEKTVKAGDWFFKSHFFSDPVQPGSLGLEMMLQLLQFFMLETGMDTGIRQAYFEPLALDASISWKFRGQVRPENQRITADVEIVSVETRADSVTVIANGSLWVDSVRCYEAKGIGIRIREGRAAPARPPNVAESLLDPAVERWVSDHRPSYTVPVMPGMSMVDRLAGASLDWVRAAYPLVAGAPDWRITGSSDFRAHGWLVCDRPKRLRTDVRLMSARAVHRTDEVETSAVLYDVADAPSPPKRVASGRVRVARRWPTPPPAWPPLADATVVPSPYESGSIYWGPRLQLLRRLAIGAHGASAELDAAGADAPIGALHHILLDGALHAIPHDELERWSDKILPGQMGVPVRLAARFFGPAPRQGTVRAEIRFVGFDGAAALPTFNIQIIDPQGQVWASLRHVEVLIPTSHQWPREVRAPFLVERRFVEGAGLSTFYPDRTELAAANVKRMDSLPGSVAHTYGLDRDAAVDNRIVAIKDHVAQRAHVHPASVRVDASFSEGRCDAIPNSVFPVSVELRGEDIVVRDAGEVHER